MIEHVVEQMLHVQFNARSYLTLVKKSKARLGSLSLNGLESFEDCDKCIPRLLWVCVACLDSI